MRFQVPQFIEHETKVIGPLTFKQFIYLAAPGALAFFLFFVMPFNVFLVFAIALGLIGLGFAFGKSGGKSLPELLLHIVGFAFGPKTYIWKGAKRKTKTDILETYNQTEQEKIITEQIKFDKKNQTK